jgi:hypothetical protein
MDVGKHIYRRPLKSWDNGRQHIVVGMGSASGKVIAVAEHWSSGCEKVKSEFDGDC